MGGVPDWQARFPQHGCTLDSAGASLRGDPFSTWAGPVSVAFGAEARWEEQVTNSLDATSAAKGFSRFNFSPLDGGFNVQEAFGEVAIPLLDQPFSKLDVNGAARYSRYSTSGGIWSWKLGVTDRIFDNLLLRSHTLSQLSKCRKRSHLSRWRTFQPRKACRMRCLFVRPLPKTFRLYTLGTQRCLYLCIDRLGICRCCLPHDTSNRWLCRIRCKRYPAPACIRCCRTSISFHWDQLGCCRCQLGNRVRGRRRQMHLHGFLIHRYNLHINNVDLHAFYRCH